MNKNGNDDNPTPIGPHPLERMHRLTACQLKALESRWMTTVDSFVAAASTEEGQAGLRRALDIDSEALDILLLDARDALGEERYRELSQAKSGGPTGALWDEDNVHRNDHKPDEGGQET